MQKLGKSCVLVVFFSFFKIVNHVSCPGNMARALTQWLHLVASPEATNALHQAMCPALPRRIRMAIKMASI